MKHQLTLSMLSLCTLALSACPPSNSSPTQQPTPGVSASPSASSSGTPVPQDSAQPGASNTPAPGASATATPTPTPSSTGGASFTLPDNVVGIRFANNDRFLDQKGESTVFKTELVDRSGNVVTLNTVPLEWSSDKPTEFSVDQSGKITALVDAGFATITVRVSGTNLEARSVINVSTGSSGGGGGGGGSSSPTNPAPVISSVSASSTAVNGSGTLVKLTAVASDANNTLTNNSFTWSCSANCNTFESTTGSTVYWRSPETTGDYVLRVTVSDGSTSVNSEVTVTVTTGQGDLVINTPGLTFSLL